MLKQRGSISVQEMSEQLGITKVAVRKHLDVLHRDRYIEFSMSRQQTGRPAFVYHLTSLADRLFPNHYDGLATEIIDDMNEIYGDSFVDQLFERRMGRTAKKYRQVMAGQSFEAKLLTLAKLQDEEGYMTKVEKLASGAYSFEEANCPISQVALRYRQACRCESRMFAALLGASVERTECIAQGSTRCRYLVTERNESVESAT